MNKLLATLLLLVAGAPAGAADLHRLRDEVKSARVQTPAAFEALAALRARVIASPPPLDRRGVVARQMVALGPDGLYPLLALLEPDAAELASASARSRAILRQSAVEALIKLADLRAAPLLRTLLDSDPDDDVARGAADALGVLETREEALFLIARAQPGAARDRAAISGLSLCRRPEVAAHLAARLSAHPDDATAAALADAIAFYGSSWAWEALGPTRAADGERARLRLTQALLAAYPGYRGHARQALGDALVTVAHPTAPNALSDLRARAPQALAADLQSLERRLTR